MNKELPPFPRKNRGGSYTTGCGVFWYKVWKEEYHDLGGVLGYASWLEELKRIDRENRKYQKAMEKKRKKQ